VCPPLVVSGKVTLASPATQMGYAIVKVQAFERRVETRTALPPRAENGWPILRPHLPALIEDGGRLEH
jgi:hypothetical protein